MTRVLFVGQQPETVNFADPTLPPGMNPEKIHVGIRVALKQMAERGWHADLCLLKPDETAGPECGPKAQGPSLRLCGDRRWHSPAQPVDV